MNKKLECIKRLVEFERFYDLKEWMVESKLALESDFKGLTRDSEKAEYIYITLTKAAQDGSILMLLDYEWSLLPFESIKLTCITNAEKKEFTVGL